MKTRKFKTVVVLALSLAGAVNLQSQDPYLGYRNGIGLRAGYVSGVTYKHVFANNHAFEGIVGVDLGSTSLTGLYEWNKNLKPRGFTLYYGGGAHVAFYENYNKVHEKNRAYRNSYQGIGLDFIAGVEYKIPKIPFAVSLDMKPDIELRQGDVHTNLFQPGLGFKFIF